MIEPVAAPYAFKIYHTVSDLSLATSKFEELKGLEWAHGIGKALLIKHGMR
jgi:hypothetical protein